jgi:hypothetical protein
MRPNLTYQNHFDGAPAQKNALLEDFTQRIRVPAIIELPSSLSRLLATVYRTHCP